MTGYIHESMRIRMSQEEVTPVTDTFSETLFLRSLTTTVNRGLDKENKTCRHCHSTTFHL